MPSDNHSFTSHKVQSGLKNITEPNTSNTETTVMAEEAEKGSSSVRAPAALPPLNPQGNSGSLGRKPPPHAPHLISEL